MNAAYDMVDESGMRAMTTNSPSLDKEIETYKRKIGHEVKLMKILWPATIILTLYLRYFGEKGSTFTMILAGILVICIIAAFGATYEFLSHRKELRRLAALSEEPE